MAGRLSDLKEKWLTLTCPACRVTLRIREAYGHLKGRCPECGYRISPPRPKPAPPPRDYSDSDEPLGLVPIEEEWPEPAQVEKDAEDQSSTYTVAEPHATPPLPKPIGLDEDELYHLAMGGREPAAPTEGAAPGAKKGPYEMHLPAGGGPTPVPITYRLSEAELNPLRPSEPPAWPLVQGIYTFPWRLDALGLWLVLSFKFGILAGLGCLIILLIHLWQGMSPIAGLAVPPMIAVLCMSSLWVGAYAAVQFISVLEETAAGNDRVPRPEWTIIEGIMKCLFLLWIAACSLAPGVALGFLLTRLRGAAALPSLVLIVTGVVLFPVLLLSSLSAPSAWMLLDKRFLSRYLAHPQAVLALTLPSFMLLVPCVLLPAYAVANLNFLLTFLSGFVWAASMLIYARLLGRVAWYTTLRKPKRALKRKRIGEAPTTDEV